MDVENDGPADIPCLGMNAISALPVWWRNVRYGEVGNGFYMQIPGNTTINLGNIPDYEGTVQLTRPGRWNIYAHHSPHYGGDPSDCENTHSDMFQNIPCHVEWVSNISAKGPDALISYFYPELLWFEPSGGDVETTVVIMADYGTVNFSPGFPLIIDLYYKKPDGTETVKRHEITDITAGTTAEKALTDTLTLEEGLGVTTIQVVARYDPNEIDNPPEVDMTSQTQVDLMNSTMEGTNPVLEYAFDTRTIIVGFPKFIDFDNAADQFLTLSTNETREVNLVFASPYTEEKTFNLGADTGNIIFYDDAGAEITSVLMPAATSDEWAKLENHYLTVTAPDQEGSYVYIATATPEGTGITDTLEINIEVVSSELFLDLDCHTCIVDAGEDAEFDVIVKNQGGDSGTVDVEVSFREVIIYSDSMNLNPGDTWVIPITILNVQQGGILQANAEMDGQTDTVWGAITIIHKIPVPELPFWAGLLIAFVVLFVIMLKRGNLLNKY